LDYKLRTNAVVDGVEVMSTKHWYLSYDVYMLQECQTVCYITFYIM